MRKFYKFQEKPEHIEHILTEIEDNLVPYDSKGDIVIDRDIHCRSIYVEGNSLHINGIKIKSPTYNDNGKHLKYDWKERKFEYTNEAIPSSHASSHEEGGTDLINHDSLTGRRGVAVYVQTTEPTDQQINDIWIKL